MKKLSLNLDELKVESFETEEKKEVKGTVNGQIPPKTEESPSCDITLCDEYTCNRTCGNTCGETCVPGPNICTGWTHCFPYC